MTDTKKELELTAALKQFTGTESYTQYGSHILLTDGTLFLAEQAQAFWLIDLFGIYLVGLRGREEFVCLKILTKSNRATVSIEDGNDNVFAKQEILYTDFPLSSLTLYACWYGKSWVVMLPSEY
jgi:hypothetical protein